ncbi:MAG: hypothetical protein JWL90_1371 [Chthoniobacteraceae bacterium]|nr:hypothetical protein [Chthoniobacteraceae bacterium]
MRFIPFLALVALIHTNASAEDFITNSGVEYIDATLNRVEPDGLVLNTSDGVVKLNFADLSADDREKYGFDEKKAREYAAAMAVGKAENRQRAQAGMAAELVLKTGVPAAAAKPEAIIESAPATSPAIPSPASVEQPVAQPKPRTIHGTVKQRTETGLLVSGVKLNPNDKNARPIDVWLTGYDAKAGTKISVTSFSTGRLNFRTADGDIRVLESFEKSTVPSVSIKTEPQTSKYLTNIEAAQLLGISRFAFLKLGITQVHIGKAIRYDLADIKVYVDGQKVKP